ncbi:ABC transporter substrate-binding protein [Actinomycetospora sp. TBRC 11914]|uniref:ABC transporter substrate-binding protein n=1 Tax=Actinomycetospora sp. TBRC 11914 TaxID=2729387 RepID=UPI00145F9067|nr:transporter substrate-binding domain-containing protein [Actinomycetospora sp. TBRC 11914]NMO91466.1 transporter substrate-binding domain-containing protein [Actinomycetospora sp. TBRC 11914]
MIRLLRRAALAVVPLAIVSLALTACSSGGSGGSGGSGATLRVGVIVTGSQQGYGVEQYAYSQGILQRHLSAAGIGDVAFTSFPNGPNLNQALKGGSLDMGVLGDTPAVSGRAANLPTELSGVSLRGQDAWLIAGRGVTSLNDLRGKTVATQQGSYMHRYLVGLLQQAGLASQVKITFLLANSAQQALDKGDIAAYAAPVPVAPQLAGKGYAVIDKASAHPGLPGNSYITIGTDAAQKYPQLASAWNAAIAETAAGIAKDPSAYQAYAAKVSGLPQAIIAQSYPAAEFGNPAVTPTDVATAKTTLDFLVSQQLAAGPFDVNSWVAPGGRA